MEPDGTNGSDQYTGRSTWKGRFGSSAGDAISTFGRTMSWLLGSTLPALAHTIMLKAATAAANANRRYFRMGSLPISHLDATALRPRMAVMAITKCRFSLNFPVPGASNGVPLLRPKAPVG